MNPYSGSHGRHLLPSYRPKYCSPGFPQGFGEEADIYHPKAANSGPPDLKITPIMKSTHIIAIALAATFASFSGPTALASENHPQAKEEKKETTKPYKLETCIVSDDKLGEMGKPFVFVHEGQEIKLCCKSCRKDFDKDPAKYLKKLEKK